MSKLMMTTVAMFAAGAMGCAGARSSVVLPESKYAVSLSDGMVGQDQELLTSSEMQVVGHFHEERTAWGILYSYVPFTPHLDVSESINGQVAQAGGQGIVRLKTSSKACALDYFFVLSILPIWPGCTNVEVDGDIIKRRTPPATPAVTAAK